MKTLAESKFLSFLFMVYFRWNEEERWIQDFLLLPQEFQSFPSDLRRGRWRNLVWDLRTLAQFQGSGMSPGLFQDFRDEYIRLSTLAVEYSIVIMTAGSQSRRSQIESYG